MRIAPEGWPFIAVSALLALGLMLFWWPVGVLAALLAAWVVWFFRDPERAIPDDPSLLLSPADGRICMIARAAPPAESGLTETRQRVSVFMSPMNVHVNRAPAAGTVTGVGYNPGKFFNAAKDKASDLNERLSMRYRLTDGVEIAVVQIAGFLARRIVCRVEDGAALAAGERYGLIRFGSRVDLYLPDDAAPLVQVGDVVQAGETALARRTPR